MVRRSLFSPARGRQRQRERKDPQTHTQQRGLCKGKKKGEEERQWDRVKVPYPDRHARVYFCVEKKERDKLMMIIFYDRTRYVLSLPPLGGVFLFETPKRDEEGNSEPSAEPGFSLLSSQNEVGSRHKNRTAFRGFSGFEKKQEGSLVPSSVRLSLFRVKR